MKLQILLTVLLVSLPVQGRAQGFVCERGPPAEAKPYDTLQPETLAGDFRLMQVMTSWETASSDTSEVSIRLATTEEKAEAKREGLGFFPRDITHVGLLTWSSEYDPFPVEADGATLYLGCRGCLDGSPNVLYVAAIADEGFWGLWRDYQTGIGRHFDTLNNPLPDPAGYFCAQRIRDARP